MEFALLGLVLLAGLIVRGAYLLEIRAAPDFRHPAVDALTHDYWARGLATGDWTPPPDAEDPHIPETPFFRPPGYPYFLALVYKLSRGSYLAPRLVQMLLGLASAVCAYWIGRRWFGLAAALVAASGMCFYWVFVYFEGELHADALFVFLLLVATAVLGRAAEVRRLGWWGLAGALLGTASLVRPNALVLLPVAAGWAAWVQRGMPGTGEPRAPRRPVRHALLGCAAALLLPAALVISVATLRNLVVARDFVLISSNAGVNLYIGNNPQATGFVAEEIPGLGPFGTCFEYPGIVRNLEARLGRKLRHSEVSRWFTRQALGFIAAQPAQFAALTARKLRLLVGPLEVGHNKEDEYERRFSRVLRRLPGDFALALALGAVGFATAYAARRRRSPAAVLRWQGALLLALAATSLALSVLPFFVAGRYRVPVVPFLLVLGGHAVARVGEEARERRYGRSTLLAAACLALYAVLLLLPQGYVPSLAHWHYVRGTSFVAAGQPERAMEEFRAALRAEPRHARAHYNLASLLAVRGDLASALPHLEESARLRPDLSRPHHNLGAALLALGRLDAALVHLQEAVDLEPQEPLFHANLGKALRRRGQSAAAVFHLEQAVEQRPQDSDVRLELARALQDSGRLAVALPHYRRVIEMRGDPATLNDIAWHLATHPVARAAPEAVELATRACEMSGNADPLYLDTLAAAYAAAGEFARARTTLRDALARLRAAGGGEGRTGSAEVLQMEARLRLYEAGRAYREGAGIRAGP